VRQKTIGIIDYGVGNHMSVLHAFRLLGYRCRVSNDQKLLSSCDLLVLPGVGAYPKAIASLHEYKLIDFLKTQGTNGKPIIGLCLGMQLLAEKSYEHGESIGLGLIPGQVVHLKQSQWHIGWNTIEVIKEDELLMSSNRESFYFNHSYIFETSIKYQICTSRINQSTFVAGVRHGKIVGLQFHPEKSQSSGRCLLRNLVEGLVGA
jgi:glutamine amidotransferase